ncbi:MAG: Maf family protein, partial [Planctomycetota bacterium]
PRRALMLREAGFAFTQTDPPYADPADPNGDDAAFAEAVAVRLAERKAASVPEDAILPGAVLLTADTVGVVPGGPLLGTPETAAEADAMLRSLVGRTHRIVTGVALRGRGRAVESWSDAADVTLGAVADADIEAYVAGGGWRGKAGGYNLAERRAAGWPIAVDGDPGTVMGLPMRRLVPRLAAWGLVPQAHPAAAGGC